MAYNYSYNWKQAVAPSGGTSSIGCITTLKGFGLASLGQDINFCSTLSSSAAKYPALNWSGSFVRAVGALESFSWSGGITDPISLTFYVPPLTAMILQTALPLNTSTKKQIQTLGWWTNAYNSTMQQWYEQAYPKSPTTVSGKVNTVSGVARFDVDPNPTPLAANINVYYHRVFMEIVPAASLFTLQFANSTSVVASKSWGSVIV